MASTEPFQLGVDVDLHILPTSRSTSLSPFINSAQGVAEARSIWALV